MSSLIVTGKTDGHKATPIPLEKHPMATLPVTHPKGAQGTSVKFYSHHSIGLGEWHGSSHQRAAALIAIYDITRGPKHQKNVENYGTNNSVSSITILQAKKKKKEKKKNIQD